MKKIKSISKLREQKRQLRRRKNELEKAIRYDWKDLRESMEPIHIAEQLLTSGTSSKHEGSGSGITEAVSYATSLLTKKLAGRAETKFKKWFRK